ncbi:helix-turn-helix domain-containing protein [Chitinophaga sp. LS1]|uniref:helix-turn-helix domain-containing protein n=1 Tax=Chitinophaga sp. LS1 TaxID=3051176 RepID=UPI002AAC00B7|nr:helix-turn-helix domain-containing protein [Chitinophaga sp. LS1]WPV64733.1 helix-turn-helix domain-containing protein [Chitinophaga sp. LS1]
MKRITHFEGLYGESGPRPDGEYLFSELLETRSENFDWKIKPHIHTNLYQIFLIETRKTEFLGNNEATWLTGPSILLIPPLAIHGFNYHATTKGRILTISDKLVSSIFPMVSSIAPMLESLQILTHYAPPYTFRYVVKLVEELHEELFDTRYEKQQMLTAMLQQLFLVLYRLWRQNSVVMQESDSISLSYFRKLQKRISEAGSKYSIDQYARELGITPVHLNRVCNSVAGKSAHQLLQDHLVDEAKKHLRYTSYTVSEIAYLLNFEYPNYFARFFKKVTGLSPSEYRKI